jgi:hypothetical protein
MISKIYRFHTFICNVFSKLKLLNESDSKITKEKAIKEKELTNSLIAERKWRIDPPLARLDKPRYLVETLDNFESILNSMLLSSNDLFKRTDYIKSNENINNLFLQLNNLIENETIMFGAISENMRVEKIELKAELKLNDVIINTSRDKAKNIISINNLKRIVSSSEKLNNISKMKENFTKVLNYRIQMFQIIHNLYHICECDDSKEEFNSDEYSSFCKDEPFFIDYAAINNEKEERKVFLEQSMREKI